MVFYSIKTLILTEHWQKYRKCPWLLLQHRVLVHDYGLLQWRRVVGEDTELGNDEWDQDVDDNEIVAFGCLISA